MNIKLDKPFLFVCGYLSADLKYGFTFAVDIERHPRLAAQFIPFWYQVAETFDKYFGHNIKYDLHMMNNIGYRYTAPNISDTQFYIRYGCDSIPERAGGPPLALKKFTTQYIDRDAGRCEKQVQLLRGAMAKEYNIKLRRHLEGCPPPDHPKWKSWTLGLPLS